MRLLQDPLAASAAERPQSTALVDGERRHTYGELDAWAARIAGLLLSLGSEPGDRVMILSPKCSEAVAAIQGCLRANAIYVPVDADSPAPRLARIVSAARPRFVLTLTSCAELAQRVLADLVGPGERPGLIALDHGERGWDIDWAATAADVDDAPPALSPSTAEATDLAHLLFTSGSTGIPKGVGITHRNALAFVQWAVDHFAIEAGDRNSGHPPLHFDLSTFDMFATFAAGAELHLVGTAASLNPRKLVDMIAERELTQWFSVPSIFSYIHRFDALDGIELPSLERVLWCGEVLPTPTLAYWMDHVPHARFTNLYGPTEATIASTFHDVECRPRDLTRPIPIGRPCAGEAIHVLDEQRLPVPEGEIGELYLSGIGLSPGYWEDPDKTAAVFVDDPQGLDGRLYRTGDLAWLDDEGVLHFVGRTDTQIKSRGYRIELGEIEAALHTDERLRESAVVAVETDGFEGHAICCAFVPTVADAVSNVELRARLRELVPTYMLPGHWMAFAELPKNVNGKIDRPCLRALFDEILTRRDNERRSAS